MTTLIATSVVRGSHQGESHGGVYLVDFEHEKTVQVVDWNTSDIDWQGRGWDRGLRGIAFDGDRVFIAASNELFEYTPDFKQVASYKCPGLMHCHEISVYKRRLYLTSTGFDAILAFDLDNNQFCFGLQIKELANGAGYGGGTFNPNLQKAVSQSNELHINNVFCDAKGLYISGLKTRGLLRFDGRRVEKLISLPKGMHNARPYRDGVLFNDTASDVVRYVIEDDEHLCFNVPQYAPEQLLNTEMDDTRIARSGFGRGLCDVGNGVIAGGSSPSTIALHNVDTRKTFAQVNLTMDIRNAIHGLEVWPF
ncbi:hypothetical protein [Dasania marina]|uniref:hypothetical protein n=1 Tax=Dasania marina TaxID=471499 RepID=UPI0030D9D15C|tara:strand:- start:34716 stop:35639 length:924 start_codon:yes stop_codon:yes gene_type:complete